MPDDLEVLDLEESAEPEEEQLAEPTIEGEEIPEGEQPPAETTGPVSLLEADGKKLSAPVKAALTELKAQKPEVAKVLMKAIFRTAELDREFPGGLTEAREIRDKVEEFGGLDKIQERLDGASELTQLATAFSNADPAFVEDMVASDPRAFAALAPVVFSRFAQVDAEGYKGYIGRVIYSDMQRNEVPLLLQRLADTLGENAKAAEYLNQLSGYLGNFKTLAEKPYTPPQPQANQPKPENQSQREEDLRSREWKLERNQVQGQILQEAKLKALGSRRPTSEDRAEIDERFRFGVTSLTNKLFPGWNEKAQKYIKSNDKSGYLRYMKSIYARVFPDAMATAVEKVMKGRPAGGPQNRQQQPTQNGTQPKPAAEGYKIVTKVPNDIDWSRTSRQMIEADKYILTDGRKVQVQAR